MHVRLLRALCLAALVVLLATSAMTQDVPRAEIMQEMAHSHSAPLRDFVPYGPTTTPAASMIALRSAGGNRPTGGGGGGTWKDAVLQTGSSLTTMPATGANFDGAGANGYVPPDTNLAVGPTQVVQTVNVNFQVFDKAGNSLLGPANIHTIFTSLGGMCGTSDGGDPIVLYDQFAGRWIISQLQYNKSFSSNLLCVAVSTGTSATGAYNLYAFNFGNSLPDYPKLGVWPDGYYLSANMFTRGSTFAGAKACVLDRSAMLAGTAANGICFQNSTAVYNLLPADADGPAPSSPEPDFFVQFTASSGVGSALNLYKLSVGPSFSSTTGFTFTGPVSLPVQTYHEACGGGACVPQSGSSQKLDSLGDRLMYRLQYRNFGTRESLVVNHSVQVSSSNNQTGIRWYEIQDPNGTPTVVQQSTYAPDFGASNYAYRWMGSIAQDKAGNMAVGYSYSSSSVNPAIYFTGRNAADTPNQMGIEQFIVLGTGSQTSVNRWGDYSSMAIDPTDDCTFWYTTEYLQTTGSYNWNTRIASFKFASCN